MSQDSKSQDSKAAKGNPTVSICLMTYNGAATIERALSSLLAQTYRDYELIISDDHSSDDTRDICRRVANGHEQVIFIAPERNIGAQFNMRFALSHARGKYFLWSCQDDHWEPRFLERLVDALEASPKAICAQGQVRWASQDRSYDLQLYGRDLPEQQSRLMLATAILTAQSREGNVRSRTGILKNNIFMHGVWSRKAFEAAIDTHGLPFANERQILCQLALSGDFRFVDELLFHKTFYEVKLSQRRSATEATVVAQKASNSWTILAETLRDIARSPIVPIRMKVVGIPVIFSAYARRRLKTKKLFAGILARAFSH